MSHVFISYVREDSDRVDRLKASLDAAGAHTWIDREDIEGGKNWKSAIREAVKGARFFIACFSKFFADRQRTVMFDELRQAADELRMRPPTTQWFLPVLLDEVEVPDLEVSATEYLSLYERVPLFEDWDAGVERLLRVIEPGAAAWQRERRVLDLPRSHVRVAQSTSASTLQRVPEPQPPPERPPPLEPSPTWLVHRTRQIREGLHGAQVAAVAFDPGQPRLMTAGGDVTRLWGLPRLEPLVEHRHTTDVMAALFCAAGRRVATATADRIVQLWDSVSESCLEFDHRDTDSSSVRWVPRMAFSTSGDLLAVGSLTGELRVWETATGRRLEEVLPLKHITALAFGPFNRLLAIGRIDGSVQWLDVGTGQPFPKKQHAHHDSNNSVEQVLFSPDGARVVSVGREGSLRAWDVESGREEHQLCRDGVRRVAFGRSPALLAGGGMDGSLFVLDTDAGHELNRREQASAVKEAVFNSEVEIVATISEDQRAHIWDTRSGETITLDDHFLVRRIALGPDGSLLATVGVARSDGTAPFEPPNDIIRVWTGVSA